MKLNTLFLICLAIALTACSQKEQAAAPVDEVKAPEAATAEAVTEPAAEESTVAGDQMGTAAFIEHMHHHASQLGQLKAALKVGSLPAAQRPAYWLSGHEEVSGVPEGWRVYIDGMHDGARAVDSAENIEQARAAAKQIEASCNACHESAGIEVEI